MLANGRKKFANRMLQLQFAGRIVTGNWELGTGIAAYSLTCISLLELVLSGKLLYLTTFSSRAAKMKKMNRPKFASAKPTENKKKVA